jgi:hypothetical protein
MNAVPPFSKSERWVVDKALEERFGSQMNVEEAETELRLHPSDRELVVCPALYWQGGGCHFLICKVKEGIYRSQFFYSVREQYSTGIEDFTDIGECVVTLLQMQADHASQREP